MSPAREVAARAGTRATTPQTFLGMCKLGGVSGSFYDWLATVNTALLAKDLRWLVSRYTTGPPVLSYTVFKLEGAFVMGEITVKDDEANLHATVTALDAEGNQTTFDQTPTWASSDDSVATVQPSDDGYSATFTVGAPGSAVITVTGVETHDGAGDPTEILSVGTITVTAGDATVGSVDFSVTPTG